ncbi:hypothetical protein BEH94_04440 [Candidatus Altiarchaeales archaeon WOR_SM1_SCG]|nr:hypothetical protein BEH94_04440 [Candidatus Altiarchaeales archaeon WOR_SM1_SCG]
MGTGETFIKSFSVLVKRPGKDPYGLAPQTVCRILFFCSAAASGITLIFEGVENPTNVKEQVNKTGR